MAAEAAKILDYSGSAYYGSASPAEAPYVRPAAEPVEIPVPHEQTRTGERAKTATQSVPIVSMFAIFGAVLAGIMMLFVVLAQINYNEIAGETARLNTQLGRLSEQERRLEIEFENVIDMKEVERYARDTLGMSKPSTDQVAVIGSLSADSVEIIETSGEESSSSGIGSFIQSLLQYFKR